MSAERYAAVAATLPAELPAMDRRRAQRIATAIVRKFWPTSVGKGYQYGSRGVRRCWLSKTPTQAQNSDKGLGRIVHDLSHDIFDATYHNTRKAHDPLHAGYEVDVAQYVARNLDRWVKTPELSKPTRPTLAQRHMAEYVNAHDHFDMWRAQAKRAIRGMKKWRAKQRRLERSLIADANRLEIYGSDPL